MMPKTLTLVRHGESESNKAKDLAEAGTPHPNEAKLMRVHTSERRLTPHGVEQAQAAGRWLNAWFAERRIEPRRDCRLYVSPYARTLETAGHMRIADALWRPESRIVERNWGSLDELTYEERMQIATDAVRHRKEHAFFWCPPGGEAIQNVFGRYRDLVGTMHRDCSDQHVVLVTHGELMLAARYLHEYWMPLDLRKTMFGRDDQTYVCNCRIIQYSRISPKGIIGNRLRWVRFIDPMAPSDPNHNRDWQRIHRPRLSTADLLAYAKQYKRFLD